MASAVMTENDFSVVFNFLYFDVAVRVVYLHGV
jgi:hypothetical protein